MSPVERQRPVDKLRHTAVGSSLAAGLLGLRDALEGRPEREESAMETEAPAAPPPDGIELFLDPDHPERSVVVIHAVDPVDPSAGGAP